AVDEIARLTTENEIYHEANVNVRSALEREHVENSRLEGIINKVVDVMKNELPPFQGNAIRDIPEMGGYLVTHAPKPVIRCPKHGDIVGYGENMIMTLWDPPKEKKDEEVE
nr:hypothetical protein [Candidatus Sigynarchaeota archaeon]